MSGEVGCGRKRRPIGRRQCGTLPFDGPLELVAAARFGRKHPDVQLVPVHLENLNRILPKGEFLLIPLLAAVTFGAPIRIEEGEEKPAFLERARNAVEALASAKEEG